MPTLTDAGLCHALDSNSFGNTFVPTERIVELNSTLGSGIDNLQPNKINGTGFLNQRTYWLDVGIRFVDLQDMIASHIHLNYNSYNYL